jgi:L-serine dehydratase
MRETAGLEARLGEELRSRIFTLGELIELASGENIPLSTLVVVEAQAREGKSREAVLDGVYAQFEHNLRALALGLQSGRSFLLGTVGAELAAAGENALIGDRFINNALVNTLGTEVGNHVMGLRPCAGTGDSCPYTGLVKAMLQEGYDDEQIRFSMALILKIGSIFRAGKRTTGCNMEGFGAGAAVTAAVLTELRGGTPGQVAHAIVLALSPTIAVPCTPRVMVSGLCATHIGGAILIGNLAANLSLRTTLPVEVDVDVMIALAAKVHADAAPAVTKINQDYLIPYFKKNAHVDAFVADEVKAKEAEATAKVLAASREEVRAMLAAAQPLTQTMGAVVVGGSSIAVGSPTNMARIAHALARGEITGIEIELTSDLFKRRAINIPAILMAAVTGAKTDDIVAYRSIFDHPGMRDLPVSVTNTDIPEVQRIRITATEQSAYIDSRNRGGGRVNIVAAEPSREEAVEAAQKLGIQLAE